jgi:integrase
MARKRAIGEETIYPRKDGRWEAAIYSQTTSGTRKRIRRYARTRPEAVEKLDDLRREIRQGIPIPDRTWHVKEYLDYWLEQVVKPSRRYNTFSQCERTARLHLKPGLGHLALNRLTVQSIQHFLNQKLAEGCGIPNLQVMKKVLSAALTNAMRDDLIVRNPARLVTLPAYDGEDYIPWTPAEAQAFLYATQSHPFYPAFLVLIISGLRMGELLGLVWRDVDWTNQVLHIRRQLQRTEHGLQLVELKTKASRCDTPLLEPVAEVLYAHRDRQLRSSLRDNQWVNSDAESRLVFPAEHGKPLQHSTLRRAFRRVCRENGIRVIRPHDARDGLATLLDDMDISAKQIQGIMRHSRVTTTLEHYVHARVAKQRGIMVEVGKNLLPGKEEDDMEACRPGAADCRQDSRQSGFLNVISDWFVSGAGQGTLTPGLVLGKGAWASADQRWPQSRYFLQHRTRIVLLGVVAVSSSRRTPLKHIRYI